MKRFSVIVPVYNVEKYLIRCVNSLLEAIGQMNIPNAEIILVNDGSTDGSPQLCDELFKMYQNIIRVVHKENGGLASARNAGIEQAEGEYILFVDSDDWIESETLREIERVIDSCRPDVIKYGYNRIENKVCVYGEVPCLNEKLYDQGQVREQVYPNALGNGSLFDYNHVFIMSAWSAAYRKEIIINSNIFFHSEREILNEDILFNIEILLKTKSVYILHRKFYNYDCRDGSLTQRYKPAMYERKCALLDYYEPILKEEGLLEKPIYQGRYAQFVIQHMYDCAVMEVQWNEDRVKRSKELKEIITDSRLKIAEKRLTGVKIGLKAKLILFTLRLGKPLLFYCMYRVSHLKGR